MTVEGGRTCYLQKSLKCCPLAPNGPLNGRVLCPGCLCLVLSPGFVSQLCWKPLRIHRERVPCSPRKCEWNHYFPLMPYRGMGLNPPRSNSCVSLVSEVLPLCEPVGALCKVIRQNLGIKLSIDTPGILPPLRGSVSSTLKTSPKRKSVLPSTVIILPDWLRGLWNS